MVICVFLEDEGTNIQKNGRTVKNWIPGVKPDTFLKKKYLFKIMEEYRYTVAGHCFSVHAADGLELSGPLAHYAPFAAKEQSASEPVFRLSVVQEAELPEPADLVEEFDQDDDGSQIRIFRTAEGASWLEFLIWDRLSGRMLAARDFSEATLAMVAHPDFALNNALMVMYAMSTARKGTALFHAAVIGKGGNGYLFLGKSGAGKTTLFRLMLALAEPDSGKILLYDDAQEVPVSKATRGDFIFVPQGNSLLSGSVRFNLQLAQPTATDAELQEVLHMAMADFVDELPDGLDTELGERGIGLSEGQAQRIAIARGLLRPGSILLLDEISSALDEATERELFSRIFAAFPDRTMILITHRPAVAALCDETIRL